MGGKMTVLVVEPGKAPYIQEIGRSLSKLQKVGGGAIEGAYPYQDHPKKAYRIEKRRVS